MTKVQRQWSKATEEEKKLKQILKKHGYGK